MISPGAVDACRDVLRADGSEFYRESHARIWRAALALTDAREPVDAITLTDRLEETGQLEDVGGRSRLYELAGLVPATANAAHYAGIVVENARLRELIRIGGEISRLGWERPGDVGELEERARALIVDLDRSKRGAIDVETWAQFERSATEHVPTIVDGLWPAGALGFIAAPPKKGKTWIGLSLAISVATGKPFLDKFTVSEPQPVVLLAAEGHRAAIRGRIGALARGMGVDPDTGALANLNIVYKPRGLNLADSQWVRTVRDTIDQVAAKLLIVDVLRAAAVMKENSNDEFGAFLHQLSPITHTGCSIALLHHFGKLTEITKERSPGERMAGAGAMYGAFDVGVFITGSDDGAKKLRVVFETRDLATPEPIGVHLDGTPTGINGGFVYHDSARWEIQEAPEETSLTANAAELIEWLDKQPGRQATTVEIIYGLNTSESTVNRRRPGWIAAGVIWTPKKGSQPALYSLPPHAVTHPVTSTRQPQLDGMESTDLQEESPNGMPSAHITSNARDVIEETADLQAESHAVNADSPTESRPPANAVTTPRESTDPDDDIDWGLGE